MSDIPDKLEWDSQAKRWVPYEGTPGRPTAERDLFTGEWNITKPPPLEPTLVSRIASMGPASIGRGFLERAQSTNLIDEEPETAAANIAELERRKQAIARPANIEEGVSKLKEAAKTGVMDVITAAFENPSTVLSLLGEGLGASIPDFAAGYAGAKLGALAGSAVPVVGTGLGGAAGTAAGFGLSSGLGQYGQSILSSLERRGINLSNRAEVQEALQDTEMMEQIREDAKLAGLSVGLINVLMAALPGNISKLVGAVPREATKYTPAYAPSLGRRIAAGTGEVAAEVGLGGLGGAIPGYIETGEVSPLDVIMGAGVGIPFAGREAYRAVRGLEAKPGIATRAEFNTRQEAEAYLKDSGYWRSVDSTLNDEDLKLKAEEVKDATGAGAYQRVEAPPIVEQELERRAAVRATKEPKPEPPIRTELEVVRKVEDPQTEISLAQARKLVPDAVLGQRIITDIPPRPAEIPRTVGEGEILTVGPRSPDFDRIDFEQAAIREQLAEIAKQRAEVPASVRSQLDARIEQLRLRYNELDTARTQLPLERPQVTGEVGRVRTAVEREVMPPTPEGTEQRRYETLVKDIEPGKPVGNERFPIEVLQRLDERGLIRKIPGGEDYIRVNEPFKIDAPISRNEYRVITDRLNPARGEFEPGDPVTVPQIQGMLLTERGKPVPVAVAKDVLQFFENNNIVKRGRDENGKPALLNNYKPKMEFAKPAAEPPRPTQESSAPKRMEWRNLEEPTPTSTEPRNLEEPAPRAEQPKPQEPAAKSMEWRNLEEPTPKRLEWRNLEEPAPKAARPKRPVAANKPPETTAKIEEHAKQQGDAPVATGVRDDRSAAAATKEVLPETSKVYSERATVSENVEKDMRNLNGPKGMFADVEPKAKLPLEGKAPLDADGLTFMGWFNKHIFTLDYALAVVPKLKGWGNQTFAREEISTKIRRESVNSLQEVNALNKRQMALFTDMVEAHSALGGDAVITNLPDGSVRLTGKAGDLKMPLQRGTVDVDITLPKDIAPAWRKYRETMDDFWRMRRESELQRYGFDPKYATDLDALRTRIEEARINAEKTTDPAERAILLADVKKYKGLETYLEITDNYREGYTPHIRPSGDKAVALIMVDPNGRRHQFGFDHPLSLNRARRAAQNARLEYEAMGWKYEKTILANMKDMFSTIRGYGQALDQVEHIANLLMHGRDDFVRGEGNRPLLGPDGKPIRISDQMFELMGELRQRYLAEKAGGRYAKTKFVPGVIHKWNREGYVQAVLAEYFGAGAEHIANNLTWRTRSEELSKLRSSPDLLNFALNHEQRMQESEYGSAVLRAMGFHFALGFNLASALLNAFQLFQSTLPYLAGMGGTLRASRYTMSAMKDTLKLIDFKLNPDEVFSLKKKPKWLTDDEYKFLTRARDLGKFDPILMREFSGGSETLYTLNKIEQNIGNAVRKVGQVSSLAFSAVEQAGRVAAMLAAYRMFKSDPKAFAKAQKFSVERGRLERAPTNIDDMAMFVSEETMFNGTKANRPAFMRGMWAVPFQFSQYPLMMMQLMMRVAGAGGRGVLKTKEGGLMLGLMLAGVWTTAGVLGLPGVQQASSAINVVSKDLAPLLGMEPADVQKLLRENLAKVLSEIGAPSDANALDWILKGGFRQLTGISTEKRTALDWPNTDMLSPDIMNFMGPAGSIVTSGVADAVEHFKKGNTALGIASLFPNLAARNVVRALHAKPGVFAPLLGVPETGMGIPSPRTGESVIKLTGEPGVGEGPLSKPEFVTQLIGFTPSRIADIREAQQAVKGDAMEKARINLTDQLASLLVKSKLSDMSGNPEEAKKYRTQFQNIVRDKQNQDKGKKDPRDRFIPDPERFGANIQNQVKRKLEGPFGQEALKRFREQDRPFVLQELRRLYGISE